MLRPHQIRGTLIFLLISVQLLVGGEAPIDWSKEIRQSVAAQQFDRAMKTCEDWIRAYPNDLDARGWHARILRWQGKPEQAAGEYRALLARTPMDADLLLELSRILVSRGESGEALELLERAVAAAPECSDCLMEKAGMLARAGRRDEARDIYRSLAAAADTKEQSRAALLELGEGRRYRLTVGANSDLISYAPDGSAFSATLDARWNAQWSTSAGMTRHARFGKTAEGMDVSATYRPDRGNAIVVGVGSAGDAGIAPRALCKLGYGHGFRFARSTVVRGIELSYDQRWLWYPDVRIVNFAPGTTVYLPRDWIWTIGAGAARTVAANGTPSWSRSAQSRLLFPVHRGYTGQVLVASGAENFGTLDQVLYRNSKLAAAGLKVRIAPGQEISTLVGYQQIAGGRTQISLGLWYAVQF